MSWQSYSTSLTPEDREAIVKEASSQMAGKLTFAEMVDVNGLTSRAHLAVQQAVSVKRITVPPDVIGQLVDQVVGRVGGLGFLLPIFKRSDVSEIALNPDGTVWLLKKGAPSFTREMEGLVAQDVDRAVEALLRPVGRAVNEATPSVDAKLPRTDSLPGLKGGARVKILHPVIVPGKGFPSINIRLFEPNPVSPEKLISWNVAPEIVIRKLLDCVSSEIRMMVIGGTATGKTTLLSAICNGIPKDKRVIKIEDPEEIWIDHPHVVTIEARPVSPGVSVLPYAVKDGVDDAMRMSPRYLIVGEVRRGDAALALFRAMMSDHPGLTTFHASSPEAAVHRLSVIMFADAQVRMEASKEIFSQAVDMVCQVGWLDGRRQLLGIWEVSNAMKGGEVQFRALYRPGDTDMLQPGTRE